MYEREGVGGESVCALQGGRKADQPPCNLCDMCVCVCVCVCVCTRVRVCDNVICDVYLYKLVNKGLSCMTNYIIGY